MRRAARRDANEPEIIQAIKEIALAENIEISIFQLSQPGICDLLIGAPNGNFLIEVKGKKGKITPQQTAFFTSWKGPAYVTRSASDVKIIMEKILF